MELMTPEMMKVARDAVTIDPLLVQDEFVEFSSTFAFWNAKLTHAKKAHAIAKAENKFLWAKLWLITREKLLADGKATEALIEATVQCLPEWQASHLALIELESEAARFANIVDALVYKKDMLISLGAHIRVEMGGDPTIRKEQNNKR